MIPTHCQRTWETVLNVLIRTTLRVIPTQQAQQQWQNQWVLIRTTLRVIPTQASRDGNPAVSVLIRTTLRVIPTDSAAL